jgi:hypothetical protein
MTNDFANIPAENEFRNEMTVESQEVAPDSHLEAEYEDRNGCSYEEDPSDGYGWPGDGSGTDDLADYNANEADDYRDE